MRNRNRQTDIYQTNKPTSRPANRRPSPGFPYQCAHAPVPRRWGTGPVRGNRDPGPGSSSSRAAAASARAPLALRSPSQLQRGAPVSRSPRSPLTTYSHRSNTPWAVRCRASFTVTLRRAPGGRRGSISCLTLPRVRSHRGQHDTGDASARLTGSGSGSPSPPGHRRHPAAFLDRITRTRDLVSPGSEVRQPSRASSGSRTRPRSGRQAPQEGQFLRSAAGVEQQVRFVAAPADLHQPHAATQTSPLAHLMNPDLHPARRPIQQPMAVPFRRSVPPGAASSTSPRQTRRHEVGARGSRGQCWHRARLIATAPAGLTGIIRYQRAPSPGRRDGSATVRFPIDTFTVPGDVPGRPPGSGRSASRRGKTIPQFAVAPVDGSHGHPALNLVAGHPGCGPRTPRRNPPKPLTSARDPHHHPQRRTSVRRAALRCSS